MRTALGGRGGDRSETHALLARASWGIPLGVWGVWGIMFRLQNMAL